MSPARKPATPKLATNSSNKERAAIATIAQDAWRKVGVDAQIQLLETNAFLAKYQQTRDFDAIVAGGARASWWERLRANFIVPSLGRPLGALALIAMGFLGARFTSLGNPAGIGTALVQAALRQAQQLGHAAAVLGATGMGLGVYARLGFREVCKLSFWKYGKMRQLREERKKP